MADYNLTLNPVLETYQNEQMNASDIQSDLIQTVFRRYYSMTDQQRIDLGLNDEMMTTSNLYRLINDKRIETPFIKQIEGLPAYDIRIDIDGDGLFSTLPNVFNSEMYWVPQKPINRYNANTYEKAKKQFKDNLWSKNLANNPNPSDFTKALWQIEGFWKTSVHETVKEFKKDTEETVGFDIFNTLFGGLMHEYKMNEDTIHQEVQKNQQEIILLEAAMAERGDIREVNVLKGDLIMTPDGKVVRSDNAYFDLISRNEGFEGSFYDAQKTYMNPKDHAKLMSKAYNLVEKGKFANRQEALQSLLRSDLMENYKKYGMYDPTIGHGFSIGHEDAMNAILSIQNDDGSTRYTMEGLMNGSEFLKMEDSIDVFLDVVLPEKHQFVQNLYENIDFQDSKNSYLKLALTDMAYVAGNQWIGYKKNGEPTEFMKHLNNLIATGDKKYLGVWGEENPDTMLGQMTMDANAQARKGQGGNYTRLEQDAFYIQSWFDGAKIWKQETED
jgi:hypothetical protein|tara:strand:- start:208 stop:1704 length:1497 start_codon:yes stop_codon:yes gene_type:complete